MLSLVLAAAAPAWTAATNFSTATCDALESCSPSWCERVSNSACSYPEPRMDLAQQLEELGCGQCTQAAEPVCSSEGLKGALHLDGVNGVMAAYCTDEFLVLWSNGKPTH